MSNAAELVFVPHLAVGHFISTVEVAKRIVERDHRIRIIILMINHATQASKINTFADTRSTNNPYPTRISFISLPTPSNTPDPSSRDYNKTMVEIHKPLVKQIVEDRVRYGSPKPIGFVFDMFTSTMVDVATELQVPSYIYFTSGVNMLNIIFYAQSLVDNHGIDVVAKFNDPDAEFTVPGFKNPVTSKVIPQVYQGEVGGCDCEQVLDVARSFRKSRGILVNTYVELESFGIQALVNEASHNKSFPLVYPVGPILDVASESLDQSTTCNMYKTSECDAFRSPAVTALCSYCYVRVKSRGVTAHMNSIHTCSNSARFYSHTTATSECSYCRGPERECDGMKKESVIMQWLQDQPNASVVFLCFGSLGSFDADQVREIANGLDKSGYRFLWSLRKPPTDGTIAGTCKNETYLEALPEGFLERTAKKGKVIGWAPQVSILAHPAVGGFVSHVGWNSVLESLWFGVPIATWPLYAEQQLNAFLLIKELGLSVEIRMDYKRDWKIGKANFLVTADEVENGIKKLMCMDEEMKFKVNEMRDKGRLALKDGGSSYNWLGHFIDNVINNV